jgi:DnaJ family protein B protein 12
MGREVAFSGELRSFERNVENVYVRRLQNDVSHLHKRRERGADSFVCDLQCENFESMRQQRINQEAGFFGFGANFDKIRELRKEKSESCEQLKKWGVGRQHGGQTF